MVVLGVALSGVPMMGEILVDVGCRCWVGDGTYMYM
jgi:hypothetical protein